MSDLTTPSVSDQATTEPVASADTAGQTKDLVSYDTHRKLLGEKKAMQQRLEQLERDNRERVETEAKQKDDWKKISELREQELMALKEEHGYLQNRVFQAVKKSAFSKALGGQFNTNYERLIDYDAILIDPSTGNVDELALTKYVESFRKDFREIITPQATAGVSHAAPQAASTARNKTDVFADFAKLIK